MSAVVAVLQPQPVPVDGRLEIAAILDAHPYEEVAYDVYVVRNPGALYGRGRIGELPLKVSLETVLAQVQDSASMQVTSRFTGELEKLILKDPAVQDVGTVNGYSFIDGQNNNSAAVMFALLKPFDESQLLRAVTAALIQSAETRRTRGVRAEIEKRLAGLTPRERQVFWLVVKGMLNKQIAGQLGTKEGTIKLHRANVMRKLNAQSVADLVRMADRLEGSSSMPSRPVDVRRAQLDPLRAAPTARAH